MIDYKYFLKSKRFWGFVSSVIALVIWACSSHFGHGEEVAKFLVGLGQIMAAFSIPFTFYAGAIATQPLGFAKTKVNDVK